MTHHWLKAFHVIFMVTWFAGLFYLPRLFVYHAMSSDQTSIDRFKIMERKLFYGIMMPGAILTILFGGGILYYKWNVLLPLHWMQLKLFLAGLTIVYHGYLWKLMLDFKHDRNKHSHVYYRILNEVPVIFLVGVVILAIVKPF